MKNLNLKYLKLFFSNYKKFFFNFTKQELKEINMK